MTHWFNDVPALFFAAIIIFQCTNSHAVPEHEREAAEIKLKQALELVVNEQPANTALNEIIDKHQTFRLAYMIRADMYAVRAGSLPLLPSQSAQEKVRISDLLEEVRSRYHYTPKYVGKYPASLLQLSKKNKHILLFDGESSRLYLIKNQEGTPQVIRDYYASHGLGGMSKRKEGDKRTPTGIYRVMHHHTADELPDLYGEGAYTLNYPNRWERVQGYSGSGIWLHGVPSITYSRPPRTSRGCVVVSNLNLEQIKEVVDLTSLPVILAEKIEWLDREEWVLRRNRLLAIVKQWQADWQSLDVEKYLAHYSTEYSDAKMDYERLLTITRRNAKQKTFVNVDIANIDIMVYAQNPHLTVSVFFDQNYNSNNYKVAYRKQQLWHLENNQWKIVYEGKA